MVDQSTTDYAPEAQQDKPKLSVHTNSQLEEESIGNLAAEYACTYLRANGMLRAGSQGLLFEGYFLFLRQRWFKKWQDVRKVEKMDMGKIQIIDRDAVTYELCNVQHVDRVWANLIALHNDSLKDNPPQENQASHTRSAPVTSSSIRSTLRRMHSLPLASIRRDPADQDEEPTGPEVAYVAAAADAHLRSFFQYTSMKNSPQIYASHQRHRMSVGPVSTTSPRDTVLDLEEAWAQLQESQKDDDSYPESAIEVSTREYNKISFCEQLTACWHTYTNIKCSLAIDRITNFLVL
jgi:hypothetical protein